MYYDLSLYYSFLKDLQHPNVIGVIGVCTTSGGPACIIMEYAEHGSLRDYLRKSRGIQKITEPGNSSSYQSTIQFLEASDILSFAWQIAKGMEYLSNARLVHRDLAARNVLVCEHFKCKISDFGLSRDVYLDDTYWKKSSGRIPVKWLSPESLRDHLYTTKSDVWSYGILLWELVTLGSVPYPGVAPEKLLNFLQNGQRMSRPENCSEELYSVMVSTWAIQPEDRPNFGDLVTKMHNMLKNSCDYLEVSQPKTVENFTYLQPVFPKSSSEEDIENNEDIDTPIIETTEMNDEIKAAYLMTPQSE